MADGDVGVMATERWQRLMRTAAREFATAGFESASLNRIIKACGMSKSSFYHYVDSKQQLFELVVGEVTASFFDTFDPPAPDDFANGDFWRHVEETFERLYLLAVRDSLFTDFGKMVYLRGAPAGKDTAAGNVLASLESWLLRTLAAGRDAGEVRADLPAGLQGEMVVAVVSAFDSWTMRHQDELTPAEARDLTGAQLDALKRLLAPDRR